MTSIVPKTVHTPEFGGDPLSSITKTLRKFTLTDLHKTPLSLKSSSIPVDIVHDIVRIFFLGECYRENNIFLADIDSHAHTQSQ